MWAAYETSAKPAAPSQQSSQQPNGHAPDDGRRRLGAGPRRVQVQGWLEAMQTSRPTSASGEDDDEDADRSEEYSDDGRVSD